MFICQQDTLHHFEKETVRVVLNEAIVAPCALAN